MKNKLKIFIDAAKMRGEPLDHVLLYGPPGTGKKLLAKACLTNPRADRSFRARLFASDMFASVSCAFGTQVQEPVLPGTNGTSYWLTASFAASLLPIISIASGGGPTKMSPASSTLRAKSAFSDKKPYPG